MIKSLESKFTTSEGKKKTNERLETMKEVKKMESLKQMSGYIKQVNDKVEILESKTKVTNRELERKLNNLALLVLKQFCLRFKAIPDKSGKNIRAKIV